MGTKNLRARCCAILEQHLREMKVLRRAALREVCLSYVVQKNRIGSSSLAYGGT